MSMQYGIQQVMNLQFLDFATQAPIAFADYAETSEIDNKGKRLDVWGGSSGYKLLSFDTQKESSLNVNLPLADMNLLAAISGDSIATGAQNLFKRDVLTVSGNTATMTATPIAGNTPAIYVLQGQRDNGTQITVVGSAPTANQCTISGNTITFGSGVSNGQQVSVWYQYASPSTTTSYQMKANKFIKPMTVIGNGFARDQVTGQDVATEIIFWNVKVQPNIKLTMDYKNVMSLQTVWDMYSVQKGSDLVYYQVNLLT